MWTNINNFHEVVVHLLKDLFIGFRVGVDSYVFFRADTDY